MNLSENFKKFMGMVEGNAVQLKKDLTWTPMPSGEQVWEEGKKNGNKIKDNAKQAMTSAAMDLLQTTPAAGAVGMTKKVADFFGMHKATELGDVVLTQSAKNPGKFQLTHFDGPLGQSNTVKDEQFDTMEEAVKAFNSLE